MGGVLLALGAFLAFEIRKVRTTNTEAIIYEGLDILDGCSAIGTRETNLMIPFCFLLTKTDLKKRPL